MPTSNDDLSKYLPDEATADAAMDDAASFDKEISRPELVARLARLKTNPDLGKAAREALESTQGVVPPAAIPETSDPTLPQARVQVATATVAAAVAQRPQEMPTMPVLKRLGGEHEVAVSVGVGKAPAAGNVPRALWGRVQPSSLRSMMLAVLAVMVPLIVVILLFVKPEKPEKNPREDGAMGKAAVSAMGVMTATATAAEPSAMPSAGVVGTALPAVTAVTSVPAPGVSSAAPEVAPKPSARSTKPNPPPTPPAPSVTTSAHAVPAAAPSETPSAAPAPPASTPSKWF